MKVKRHTLVFVRSWNWSITYFRTKLASGNIFYICWTIHLIDRKGFLVVIGKLLTTLKIVFLSMTEFHLSSYLLYPDEAKYILYSAKYILNAFSSLSFV